MQIRTVHLAGAPVDVRVGGPDSGDAVLLLGGSDDPAEVWDSVAERLQTSDLRTFACRVGGDTTVADVVALLDELSLSWVNLAAHRGGSTLGYEAAARHLSRFVSLVVVDGAHPAVSEPGSCPPVEVRTTVVVSDPNLTSSAHAGTRFVYGDVRVVDLPPSPTGCASIDHAAAVATEIVMRTAAW